MYIRNLELVTHQPAALEQFYTHVLQLPHVAGTPGGFSCDVGKTRLSFTPAVAHEAAQYHFAINIPPQHFAEARAWLSARVGLVRDADGADELWSDDWNAHALYFYDPAGNIVELIARHRLDVAAEGPFDASHLLAVSEIGLVVDDVLATVEAIECHTASRVYRTTTNELFTPVGDEHGLFIVVQRGRRWYPDLRTTAATAPVRVEVEDGAGTYTLDVRDGRSTIASLFAAAGTV